MYHRSIFSDEQHRNSLKNSVCLKTTSFKNKRIRMMKTKTIMIVKNSVQYHHLYSVRMKYFSLKFYLCQLPPPLFSPPSLFWTGLPFKHFYKFNSHIMGNLVIFHIHLPIQAYCYKTFRAQREGSRCLLALFSPLSNKDAQQNLENTVAKC